MMVVSIIALITSSISVLFSIFTLVRTRIELDNVKRKKSKITIEGKSGEKYVINSNVRKNPKELISLIDNLTHY